MQVNRNNEVDELRVGLMKGWTGVRHRSGTPALQAGMNQQTGGPATQAGRSVHNRDAGSDSWKGDGKGGTTGKETTQSYDPRGAGGAKKKVSRRVQRFVASSGDNGATFRSLQIP